MGALTGVVRPAGLADLDTVHALVEASDIEDTGEPDLTRADVAAILGSEVAEAWAFEDQAGAILACAWAEARNGRPAVEGEFFVRPGAPIELVDPLLDRLLAATARDADGRTLRLYVNAANAAKRAVVEARGATVVRHFFRMVAQLGPDLAEPTWPADYSVRLIDGTDADLRAMHHVLSEAFRDHWGSGYSPYDEWRARNTGREDFDPSLWWLVERDNVAVAGLIGTASDHEGFVGTLGVLASERGLGLARGLLLESFAAFANRGLPQVALAVDAENPTGAVRVYESVGMTERARWALYELATSGPSPAGSSKSLSNAT